MRTRAVYPLRPRSTSLHGRRYGRSIAACIGVALNTPAKIVVLDGDGAALMKMGVFATIGTEQPSNLLHIVLDNGADDSTGGQATAAVDFASVAIACGYAFAAACDDLQGFDAAFATASHVRGPACIHMRISPGSLSKLGRPTLPPDVVARRFRGFLAGLTTA